MDLCLCIYVYVSMYLCIYVSMYLCIYVSMYLIYVSMYLCIYVSMYLIYVSMYLCIYVSMCLWIYVSIYPSIYLSMYLCIYVSMYLCTWTSKTCIFWSGLKSSERPKIEQLLNLPSASHIWKDQKYDAKWRRKDAKDQLFDTKTVSLNPSLLAQKWSLGLHPKIHKDRKLFGSRTVQVCMCVCVYECQ